MRNTILTVKNCSENECKAIVLYFYRLISGVRDFSSHEECQVLFNALIKKLGLEKHTEKVLDSFIARLVKQKKLTRNYDEDARNCFDSIIKLPVYYKQDEDIYENCGQFSTENYQDIQLVRCIFNTTEHPEYFPKIVGYVFFGKQTEDEVFKLPREVKIPKDYLEAEKNCECVNFLKDSLKLSEDECAFLACAYRTNAVREFYDVVNDFCREDMDRISTYANEMGVEKKKIRMFMRREEKLVSFGFIDSDGELDKDAMACIENQDLNIYFEDIISKKLPGNGYELSSFAIKPEKTELIQRLLKNDSSGNILFYGEPGSGKSEYAKALVRASGLKPLIFKNEMEVKYDDDSYSDNALYRLNCLLSIKQDNCVVIVDEAETILKTQEFSFFGGKSSLSRKGTVNKMLENSENKVIWVLNYTDELDDSTLRRFTYSMRFVDMPKSMLRKIAENKLKAVNMPEVLKEKIVDLFGIYHVTGSSVDNMVKTVKGMKCTEENADRVIKDVKEVLEANSLLLFGKAKMREKVDPAYDISVLNTSIPADEVVEMVKNAAEFEENERSNQSGIRILFYGLSGTGKTELVRYMAGQLQKKIILKRASDIMGKYVGENEQHIKEAFEEAEANDAILLFDEADSFFADREGAAHSWERSMVNEFLTQMEEFSGILVCTTNLRKIMDPAMQRRFHIMMEFNPLKKQGIERLLKSFFGKYSFTEEQIKKLAEFDTVTPGDFGALNGKLRFMAPEKRSAEYIISGLCDLQKEKSASKSIGF